MMALPGGCGAELEAPASDCGPGVGTTVSRVSRRECVAWLRSSGPEANHTTTPAHARATTASTLTFKILADRAGRLDNSGESDTSVFAGSTARSCGGSDLAALDCIARASAGLRGS
jgi:hypothetical protein